MNVRRILVFTFVLWLATALAAFPFGFIEGFLRATGHAKPWWIPLGQGIAVAVAAAAVIAALAKRQSERTWEHAWAVAAFAHLLTLPLNVVVMGQPVTQWIGGAVLLLVAIVPVGVLIGGLLQTSNGT